MRQDLYRSEAIESCRPSLVGEVLAVHRVSFRLAACASVLLAAAVIAFAVLGTYTRKERVRGYLAPSAGLIKVLAPESGTLIERRISEGQRVSRGDVLFVLSTERGSLQVAQTQGLAIAQIESRRSSMEEERRTQAQIDRLHMRSMTERLGGMRHEWQQLHAAISLQGQRATQAEATATRYATLLPQKFVSPTQLAQQQADSLEQQTRLLELQRDRATLERDINTLRQDIVAEELQAQQRQSQRERDISALDQDRIEHEARRTVAITAPADGTVTGILGELGQTASSQASLLSILPRNAMLQAKLLIPSRAIGFMKRGDAVLVRLDAFPYQRFGSFRGRVSEISRTLLTPGEIGGPIALDESVYRVTVELESQAVSVASGAVPLQAGMVLEADVLLERRRLIEWLLEPIAGIAGKV